MKVLLDECLPKRLAPLLEGHEVVTVREMNWTGLSNGRLLAAANGQFDVFVTVDKNLVRQQDLSGLRIAAIVLRSRTNKLEDLAPFVPQVLALLSCLQPGTATYIP